MTAAPELPIPKKVQAHDLVAAVKVRHALPEWYVEEEMTLADRRLDLVAFNLWAAREYRVVGFEIKVSRGDWLRELADFQKTAEWTRVVDSFYVVTPPKVIQSSELPKGWGHLELVGGRLMNRAHPAKRTPGVSLPRELIARFLTRNVQKCEADIRTADYRRRMELRAEIETGLKAEHARELERLRKENGELHGQRNDLHRALGLNGNWQAHERALKAAGVFAAFSRDRGEIVAALRRSAVLMKGHEATITEAANKLEVGD